MSETLYRKYRPNNFSEVIGQAHIVRTLSNSIQHQRISQAYLFTGPRGTGKTSVARIFAKTINCENLQGVITCEQCSACQLITQGKAMDIIEIDAASNTGVDNIRDLRETIALAPASLRYKVYIIDEVHMLSTGAFNALLKTLEEPPAHAIFILATTEIHKVPETIISRCQKFDFSRLSLPNIIEKLSLIAKKEKIKVEKDALEMIALAAEGGMRDAESLFGQIISLEDKNITLQEVEEILGTTDKKTVGEIAKLIIEKQSTLAITKINKLVEDGYDLQIFTKALINYFRQLMLLKVNVTLEKYLLSEVPQDQIKKMIKLVQVVGIDEIILVINLLIQAQKEIPSSILPQLPMEIAIIKATHQFPAPEKEFTQEIVENNKLPETPLKTSAVNIEAEVSLKDSTGHSISQLTLEQVTNNWKKLLVDIRPYNHSMSALLISCQPQKVQANQITIATPYEFYCERLNETKNKLTIEEVFSKILQCAVIINVVIDKSIAPKKETTPLGSETPKTTSKQDSLLKSALEIMGGQIVEE